MLQGNIVKNFIHNALNDTNNKVIMFQVKFRCKNSSFADTIDPCHTIIV